VGECSEPSGARWKRAKLMRVVALTAEVRGEIESEDGVLIIRRIHVDMKLRASADVRETVERVHGFFAQKCPVFRSLSPGIQITSSYTLSSD